MFSPRHIATITAAAGMLIMVASNANAQIYDPCELISCDPLPLPCPIHLDCEHPRECPLWECGPMIISIEKQQ